MLSNNIDRSSSSRILSVFITIIAFIVVSTFLGALSKFSSQWWLLTGRWWLYPLIVPPLLLGFHYRKKLNSHWLAAWLGLVLAVIAVFSFQLFQLMRQNIANPPEWDFLSFWLNGQVAIRGLNFYKPEFYQSILLPFQPSTEFTSEILEVGFWYPPPTMFLFLPLGLFEIQKSLMFWYLGHNIILISVIFLLWRTFFKEASILSLGITIALVLLLPSTFFNFSFAQTTFLALFLLLLFWQNRSHYFGGVWLAIGIFVKPFLAFMLMYLVLRRQWRALISAVLTMSVLSLLAIAAFGSEVFFAYFRENPNANVPIISYTEITNQSLLATILRLTDYDFSGASPLTNPVFVVTAFIMLDVTGLIVYLLDHSHSDWGAALTLVLSLLLYPGSLTFYTVLLIIPLLLLWTHRYPSITGILAVIGFITIEYLILGFRAGHYIFLANLLFWLVLVVLSVQTIWKKHFTLQNLENKPYARA